MQPAASCAMMGPPRLMPEALGCKRYALSICFANAALGPRIVVLS